MNCKKDEIHHRTCELCSSAFIVNGLKCNLKKRFCSHLCSSKFNGRGNRGRTHTEEWKQRERERHTGVNNPFYGKTHTHAVKQFLSLKTQKPKSTTSTNKLIGLELSALDGMMLGDGHIEKGRFSARITYGCKFRETLERIALDLYSLKFSPIWHNKNNTDCFHFKSEANTFLLEQRKRWYPEDIKIIPRNIQLNPTTCYWWYIGDGYLCNRYLSFATDGFTHDDVQFLTDQLNKLGFRSRTVLKMNEGKLRPRIVIGGKDHANNFLQWLVDHNLIQDEYLYKFYNRRHQWINIKTDE